MNKIKNLSCTTILVGKKASADGSTIIARDEDYYGPVGPIKFTVRPAKNQFHKIFKSRETGVKIPLPDHAYRYTCEPMTSPRYGNSSYEYEEGGINEKNVAMSSTETTYSNERFLGCDPLVKHGVNEESMLTLVLPYIDNARQGVQRLGRLISKYGTGESNGISFSDHNEVWYMETAGGHHWVARRIPDDAYAIAPNQISIQDIDFNDHKNFMYSSDLKRFVDHYHLNLNPRTFNFRNIAGTHTEFDAHYNTPRAWYGQKLFTPEVKQSPTSQNIPFIQHANRKLTIQDIGYFLSSHYQQTPYDPFTHPALLKHPVFRPIAIDRNQVTHILQIRNNVSPQYAAIEWLAMGFLSYSPYVPFYANINHTPKNYQTTGTEVTMKSAYWMYKTLPVLIEPHYHHFINEVNQYVKASQAYGIHRINQTDMKAKKLNGQQLTDFLTKSTDTTANHVSAKTKHLISNLIKESLHLSQITFG